MPQPNSVAIVNGLSGFDYKIKILTKARNISSIYYGGKIPNMLSSVVNLHLE